MKKEATSKRDSALERVKEQRDGVIKDREELRWRITHLVNSYVCDVLHHPKPLGI